MQKDIYFRTKYIINGKEYIKLEDIPEAHRKLLVDANNNGIPDSLEHVINAANVHVMDVKEENVIVETIAGSGQAVRAPVQFGKEFALNMNPSARPSSFNVRVFFTLIGIGIFLAAFLWALLTR